MGTSTSVAQFAARISELGTAVKAQARPAVTAAALEIKSEIERSRNQAVGSDGAMSNVGRSGAKLGVGFDVKGDDNPVALMQARGPWPLVEHRISPHTIAPRRRGRSGFKAVRANGVVRRSMPHPGVANPKEPWKRGKAAGIPKAVAKLRQQFLDAVKGVIT